MFSENVKPGDWVSFVERISGRTLVKMTLKSVEFTEQGQSIGIETVVGPDLESKQQLRVAPHRLVSFPDRTRGIDLGRIEFYEPQLDVAGCTVPVVIQALEGISVHIDHNDTAAVPRT